MSAVDLKSPLNVLSTNGGSARSGEEALRAASLPSAEEGGGAADGIVFEEGEEDDESGYTVEHLSAVIRPVALTMILARCVATPPPPVPVSVFSWGYRSAAPRAPPHAVWLWVTSDSHSRMQHWQQG